MTKKVYEGNFMRDQRSGTGVMTYTDMESGEKDTYSGQWRADKYQGIGAYNWSSGAEYVGPWALGKRHGQEANAKYPDGSKYFGDFQDNKKHGRGKYTWTD